MLPDAEVDRRPRPRSTHRPARLAWEQTGLPLLAQQVGAQVLHSPFYTCPLRAGCPVTVTVHDATFFTEPEHYDKSRRTFFRSAIKTSLRRAERVIVPSKATRDELIRLLDADPTRIDVAYHGVDPAAFHAPTDEEKARVRARLGLGDAPYVAFLGAKEPRKNVPNLIRGWVAAVARPDRPAGAGDRRRLRATTTRSTRRSAEVPAHLRLLRPGYLRFADLPGFLGGALVAAYPSLRRGLRPADPGGDGLRRAGAHHAPAVAARGGRRRGRLHRAATRTRSPATWPRCSTTSRAGSPWPRPAWPGPRSSPGTSSAEVHLAAWARAAAG